MEFQIDKNWTLFLDRDGVINEKIENDYVKNWGEFSFINGALEALSTLSSLFGNIIIVTNQRGVGKGIMTEDDLNLIHSRMLDIITKNSGRIDKVYYCLDVLETSKYRKPNVGMGIKAKIDFPAINFSKSVMIGDSKSDMEFGQRLGMKTVYISNELSCTNCNINDQLNVFRSLKHFTNTLTCRH
jgi:histidinol-phosphate phosphatase family protein